MRVLDSDIKTETKVLTEILIGMWGASLSESDSDLSLASLQLQVGCARNDLRHIREISAAT